MSGIITEIRPNLSSSKEIPPSELGHSLLALIQTHAGSAPPTNTPADNIVHQLDQLAATLEHSTANREQSIDSAQAHSLLMAEMYQTISQLLDLLHDHLLHQQPTSFDPDHLQPLATSLNTAFEEIQDRIQQSEERQHHTLESTLKQWESEREAQGAEQMLQIESLQIQAQIEFNRLLRVMWLGTGLAATGAGLALFLLRN